MKDLTLKRRLALQRMIFFSSTPFSSTITNSKKMISLIKGKKMSNHQSNCTKTNENNEDNNNNYNNNNNNKLNKYVDD